MTIRVTGCKLHTLVIWMENRISQIEVKIVVQLDHIEEPPKVFFHSTIFSFLCKHSKAVLCFYVKQDGCRLDIFQDMAIK